MSGGPWRRLRLTPPVVGCLALFAGLSFLMVRGVTAPWDRSVVLAAGAARTPLLVDLMLGVTMLNEGAVPVVAAVGMCLLLWRLGGRQPALALFWAAVSGELLYVAAKAAFHRPRPDLIARLSGAGWHSYPSGHTMLAPVIWSLGLVLLARHVPRPARPVLFAFAVLIPPLMAVSRVVLGVHYPSDVLGALALGGAWMFLWLEASSTASASRSPSTT